MAQTTDDLPVKPPEDGGFLFNVDSGVLIWVEECQGNLQAAAAEARSRFMQQIHDGTINLMVEPTDGKGKVIKRTTMEPVEEA